MKLFIPQEHQLLPSLADGVIPSFSKSKPFPVVHFTPHASIVLVLVGLERATRADGMTGSWFADRPATLGISALLASQN